MFLPPSSYVKRFLSVFETLFTIFMMFRAKTKLKSCYINRQRLYQLTPPKIDHVSPKILILARTTFDQCTLFKEK